MPRAAGTQPTGGPEPYIGYVRVSTWREDKISPEIQRDAIERWATASGKRITEWVEDLDETGRNFKRKIQHAISRVETRNARGIAVWKFSRFGRNRHGIAVNLARVETVGGRLESATEPVDASTAVGKLNRGILFEIAAFESDRAGEQWKETHGLRRDAGLPATGRPRFGYIWHPRRIPDPETPGQWTTQPERYEIIPDHADLIADAYDQKIVRRETFRSLAAGLNLEGARTTRGHLWDGSSLRAYMDSGFAAGLLRLHDPECTCGKYSVCRRYYFAKGSWDPIIEPDVWDAYLARRAETKRRPPRARVATYALTSLVVHAPCRHSMTPNSALLRGEHVTGYTYRCPYAAATTRQGCPGSYVPRHRVERFVRDWLAAGPAAGVDATPGAQLRAPQTEPRLRALTDRARLEADLEKVRAAYARLAADHAIEPMPAEVYEAARRRIAEREATLRAALDRATAETATPGRNAYTPIVVGLLAEWDTLPAAAQNEILRSLIRRVAVYRVEHPGGRATVRLEVHPVWDPDPWADGPS